MAALAPLSAPHITSQMTRVIHRSVGTMLGPVSAGALLVLELPVIALAVLQLLTEMFVARNYAVAPPSTV